MDDTTGKVEDKLVVVMCLVKDNNSDIFKSYVKLLGE